MYLSLRRQAGGESEAGSGEQTNKQTHEGSVSSDMYTQLIFLNDFIRKASVFHFVIHFPEATLDLAGLFAIPIRIGGKK